MKHPLPLHIAVIKPALAAEGAALAAEIGRRKQKPEPFATAEAAWLWTMRCIMAKRAETTSERGPCEPDDVVRCLDALYRRRRIDLVHARVLRIWGERQQAPDPNIAAERSDWRLWREALEKMEWPLRVKGIVQ